MRAAVMMLMLFLLSWSAPSAALATVEQPAKRSLVANALKHAPLAFNASSEFKSTRNQGESSITRVSPKASAHSMAVAVQNMGRASAKQAQVGRVPTLQAAARAAVGLGRGVVQKAQSVE